MKEVKGIMLYKLQNIDNVIIILFIAKPIVLKCLHFYSPRTYKSCVRINNVYMYGHGHNNKHFKSQLKYDQFHFSEEELIKQVPKTFIIPSSQLQLVHNQTIIGQGELVTLIFPFAQIS